MFEEQNKLSENFDNLQEKKIVYELYSESKCPKIFKMNRSINFFQGCILKSNLEIHLKEIELEKKNQTELKFNVHKFWIFRNISQLEICAHLCLTINHYSFFAYDKQLLDCVCLKNLTTELRSEIDNKCSNNKRILLIYSTGLVGNLNLSNIFQILTNNLFRNQRGGLFLQ